MIPLFDTTKIYKNLKQQKSTDVLTFTPSDSIFSQIEVQSQKPPDMIEDILINEFTIDDDQFIESFVVGDVYTQEEWREKYPLFDYNPNEMFSQKMSPDVIKLIKEAIPPSTWGVFAPNFLEVGDEMKDVLREYQKGSIKMKYQWDSLLKKHDIDVMVTQSFKNVFIYTVIDTITVHPQWPHGEYKVEIRQEYEVIIK